MNEIVVYGRIKGEIYETILYKAPLEPRMNKEWREQVIKKCESLGATEVRLVEYTGYEKPDFSKIIA